MKISNILKVIGLLLVVLLFWGAYVSFINPSSPRGSSKLNKDTLIMEVDYSRPFKKERLIFGESSEKALVPFNNYWRLGANFATTFETTESISFAGRMIEPGKYRMYAVPSKDSWKVTLNTDAGAFGYIEPDYNNDLISINVSSKQMTEMIEQLTIDFIDDNLGTALRIRWDSTLVLIPLD